MLSASQQIVSDATEKIIRNVQSTISPIEKANKNKPVFSATKIFHVLGQMTDQISYAPDRNHRLHTPKDLPSLRLDSCMSVFNVQQPVEVPRHRSLTKTYRKRRSTLQSEDLLGFKKKRRITYNKIEALIEEKNQDLLDPKDKQIYLKQCQQQDKFRAVFEKKIAEVIHEKRKTRPKFLSSQQLKQRFSYDYDSNRVKVKNEPKNNLVSSNKSLKGQLSKSILKKALPHKLEKPQARDLQTSKVVEREKRKKSKKTNKSAPQESETEPVQVEFSNIRTLAQKIECEPGVIFSFGGEILKSKRATESINSRYSKLDFLHQKKRIQANSNKLLQYSARSSINQSVQVTKKQVSQSERRNFTTDTQRYTKSSRISIENQQMHKFLLTPLELQTSGIDQIQAKPEIQLKQEFLLNLDTNDRFNINYIKGNRGYAKKIDSSQSDSQFLVLPKPKNTFLKVRQRLQNKMAFMSQMKRKFEVALREKNTKNGGQAKQE